MTVRLRGRGHGSGVEIDALFYEIYTLRDGKIIRMTSSQIVPRLSRPLGPGSSRVTQRPEPPPIDEPDRKKNQTSKATAARITTTTTMRSAPVIRAVLPG